MVIVEYYIKGEPSRHSRYFSSRNAARNFYQSLMNDPICECVRIFG